MAKKRNSAEKTGRGEPPVVKKRKLKAETPPPKNEDFSGKTPENGTSRRTKGGAKKKRLLKVPTVQGQKAEKGEPQAAGKGPAKGPDMATAMMKALTGYKEDQSDDPLDRAKKGMEELESRQEQGTGKPRARGGGSAKAEEQNTEKEVPQNTKGKARDTLDPTEEGPQVKTGVNKEEPQGPPVRRSLLERFLDATTSSSTRSSGTSGRGPDVVPQDVVLQDIGAVSPVPPHSPVPDLRRLAEGPQDLGPQDVVPQGNVPQDGAPQDVVKETLSSNNLTNGLDISEIRDGDGEEHSQGAPGDPLSCGTLTEGGQEGVPVGSGVPGKVNITDIIGTCGSPGTQMGPIQLEGGLFGGAVKRTCDRCPLKGKCPDYDQGHDCKHQGLLDRHVIGSHLDALAAMAGLATKDLARIEEALLREAITGVPEERTDILVGEVHKRLKDLVKLLDPDSGEVKRSLTLSDGTGQVAVLIEKAKRGLLPSMSVLPGMSPQEASRRLHEDSYRSHLGAGSEMTSGGLVSDQGDQEHSSLDNEDLTDGSDGNDGLTDLKTATPQEQEPQDEVDLQSFWE